MSDILNFFKKNYNTISRFAFLTNPDGHKYFHGVDELISQKDNFIEFIKFEYFISITYNFIISLSCMFYIFSRFSIIFPFDFISSTWLLLVTLIKLIELIPKIVILVQSHKIENSSNDDVIASRRLMFLTRSNIFLFNTLLGYTNLFFYSIYFLFIRKSTICERAPQFYFIINLLVFGFFLRIVISFVNYFIYFKYNLNEADMENVNFYKDFSKRVTNDVLELIDSVDLSEENINKFIGLNEETNERDFCCICMLQFEIGENVKMLPCSNKHIFHGACIDKWLCSSRNCPTCRKEINKKLFMKNKFY